MLSRVKRAKKKTNKTSNAQFKRKASELIPKAQLASKACELASKACELASKAPKFAKKLQKIAELAPIFSF
ncbi:hypothetical protein [Peribacillus muralis]|uniref:hypothetical protein n=1 Tax=Peribacillus muralis TaxID=264697 RepID=UPI003826D1F6